MKTWTDLDRTTRWMVYQHFVQSGEAPPLDRLARLVQSDEASVRESLTRLAGDHQVVLDEEGQIHMAAPFAAFESGIRVESRGETYHAPCAWDALGIAALLGGDAVIEAEPMVKGARIRLEVRDGELLPTTTRIHFLVPAAEFWEDIGFT